MKRTSYKREHGCMVHHFYIDCFLDGDWRSRLKLIERWTKNNKYPVSFEISDERLIRRMKLLNPSALCPLKEPNRAQQINLSRQLDEAHAIGLVHGDVNAKNIACHGDRVVLLDWEPSLVQLFGDRAYLMGTQPCIHPIDLKNFSLSALTDRMGFGIWALGLSPKQAAQWSLQSISLSEGVMQFECPSAPVASIDCKRSSLI